VRGKYPKSKIQRERFRKPDPKSELKAVEKNLPVYTQSLDTKSQSAWEGEVEGTEKGQGEKGAL